MEESHDRHQPPPPRHDVCIAGAGGDRYSFEVTMESPMLGIEGVHEGDRHTLLLSGELDIASAPSLEARAQELCSDASGELVLDLSRLEFIDSAGLNAILRVRAICQEQMCDFGLTPGRSNVQRLFEVTRLIDRLPFRRSHHEEEDGAPVQAAPSDPEIQP